MIGQPLAVAAPGAPAVASHSTNLWLCLSAYCRAPLSGCWEVNCAGEGQSAERSGGRGLMWCMPAA